MRLRHVRSKGNIATKTDNYCVLHAGSMPQANWSVHRGCFVSIYISSLQRETALYFFHLLSFNRPASNKISDLARSGINVRANTIILHPVYACMFVSFQVLFFVFTCDVDSSLPPVLSHSPRYNRKLDQ